MRLPAGFRFAGVTCGIKASGLPDLTLITADSPCVAAGVYTQNLVCAAPVLVDRERTPLSDCAGVVVNSGNANACTGAGGLRDARQMTEWVAAELGAEGRQVLVMSTGVIGHALPMAKIAAGIHAAATELDAGVEAFGRAARAILTTDQGPKTASRSLAAGPQGAAVSLAGMAKGAGMIGPRMATMLAVVLTDAELTPDAAQSMLREAAEVSFNCVRVEGHTSTNDTLLLLASGAAGPVDATVLQAELNSLCIELARQIPADGEGASHLLEVRVTGAATRDDARRIAEAVADSPLVKTAITGNDPNWGRIVSAAGYAGVPFDVGQLTLRVNDILLFEDGEPRPFDARDASHSMRDAFEVRIDLVVGADAGEACVWASDLTVKYIQFNSEYTT